MSYGYHFQAPSPSSSSSSIRSRRDPHRPSSLKSFQTIRQREELTELPAVPTFIEKFEAGRSFDVEDDFAFIPELCTEEERLMMMDSGSDRSSTSSGSPQSSPLQHQVQPTPAYPTAATYSNLYSNMYKYQSSVSSRQRNAIPIVNPSTGMRVSSPPLASPGRVSSHSLSRRAW